MDSPENDKTTAGNAAATLPSDFPNQDSAIFTYISNLSPLKPAKAAALVPGFPGLGSPPIVFTSPRLNPLRDNTYFKRSLSSAELSQPAVIGKKVSKASDTIEKSKSEGSSVLVPCIGKECDNYVSVQDDGSSPSECIDAYLADAVEVDSANSAHSVGLSLTHSVDMPQLLNADSKEVIPKLDNNKDLGQDAGKVSGDFPATLKLASLELPDFQKKSSFDNKRGENDVPPSVCPTVESDVDHAIEDKHCELSVHQLAERKVQLDCTASQFLQEKLQPCEGYEDPVDNSTAPFKESFEEKALLNPKHCGMHRRCLQFEEANANQNIVANSTSFRSPSNILTNVSIPASSTDSESSGPEVSATTSSVQQLTNLTQPIISMISPSISGNHRTVSRPSGIGLHLNSIINPMTMCCGATGSMQSAEKGHVNIEDRKLVSIMGCHRPENTKNNSVLLNMRDKVSASSEDDPSYDLPLLERFEHQASPCGKRKSVIKHADIFNELKPSSPKKKRKKASAINDGDGCKRCNCKKSRCLKLYCDCFAAGIYCAEPCSCQDCFNREEYEETVLETRQLIESRNPIAFAPKIVSRATDSPANSNGGDGNNSTPSSARHKRGCNCKKSMCLKKYCECYQANVGCSSGCRCEGCKNVFGRKEEYCVTKDVFSKGAIHKRIEKTFDENIEKMQVPACQEDILLQAELCNPQDLTPLTPSFEFSDHGKDESKSQFSTRRFLPSPVSSFTFLLPYGSSPGCSGSSSNQEMLLNVRNENEDAVSYHQESDHRNVETVDEFSPRFDGLSNVCNASTQPSHCSTAMASSVSSEKGGWTTISRAQLCPGSGHLSSVSSLHWRCSPITPVAQFCRNKLIQAVDSDQKLHDMLADDMPEILKDSPTPLNAVKVSSPNKKRVSPPRVSLKERGSSSSSAGLKSGRKFILQAVPSFPPLTPCIDSKDSTSYTRNDPQDCSSEK